ncbi:hypothetical protein [Ectobacillus panaciterrae]|uniref:hypothetical protein n=1 Tax=Ectobacillus panaciterrae TaxID=363872 RepID=UPI0004168D51|nr:hypothetical protein [Ectobacillus panaciterrae]
MSLNIDSEVGTNQDQVATTASNARTRQNDPNNDLLNTELLASLIPMLNRIVSDEQQ